MSRPLRFQLARPEDDYAIRQLLRENPMGGDIRISLEREPGYFKFASVEGSFHQPIIAREGGEKKLAGFATRSIRSCFVNGRPQQIGYLGQLRFTKAHRRFFPLQQGFHFLKELDRDGRAPFYLTSIMEGNRAAERILLSGVEELPQYLEYCRFATHTLTTHALMSHRPLQQKKKTADSITIEQGSTERVSELMDFLQQEQKETQFSPVWDRSNLFHSHQTPGLTIDDFLLAVQGKRIVGCAALWDQRSFKQAVIRSYSPRFGRWRLLINVLAAIKRAPRLPPVNSVLAHCYLSHVFIQGQRSDIFALLLNAALTKAKQRKIPLLTVGFATRHPLHALLTNRYKTFTSLSRIFLVSWQKQKSDQTLLRELDNRLPGLEVALL